MLWIKKKASFSNKSFLRKQGMNETKKKKGEESKVKRIRKINKNDLPGRGVRLDNKAFDQKKNFPVQPFRFVR